MAIPGVFQPLKRREFLLDAQNCPLGFSRTGVGIFAAATYRAWSAWECMAASSLRTDEIVNISRYTSRGLVPSMIDYKRARDHIFFNILTTLLPEADSTLPVRARLISFISVGGAVAVLVVYAGIRGWLLAGLACAGLLAVNLSTLKVVLEGHLEGNLERLYNCGIRECCAQRGGFSCRKNCFWEATIRFKSYWRTS
jgi:hypothetical protein